MAGVIVALNDGSVQGATQSTNSICAIRYLNHEAAMGWQIAVDPRSETIFFTSDPLLLRRVQGTTFRVCLPLQCGNV